MKINLSVLPAVLATAFLLSAFWQCKPKNAPAPKMDAAVAVPLQTHKEAVDTLRADTSAPVKPTIFKLLDQPAAKAFWASTRLDSLFLIDYPDNGFYGTDRYRIEFVFTKAVQDDQDPSVYHVTGKNRFKKTISSFEGVLHFDQVQQFTDPNLDMSDVDNMEIQKMYTLAGDFEFSEDPNLATSGIFKGRFISEIGVDKKGNPSLWFFTNDTPGKGSGYRFDGNWTGFKNPSLVKPVLWSRDLFRFANDILENFSYGERDIEINPKYRSLGWDNFWDGEEWWHETPKKEI